MTFSKEEVLNLFNDYNFNGFNDSDLDDLSEHLFNKGLIFTYDYGVTKAVILPRHENYVIKIPFCGFFNLKNTFHKFRGAGPLNLWDYCKEETDRYNQIKDSCFAPFFAETIFVGKTNKGYPIYAQEKCNFYHKRNIRNESIKRYLRDFNVYIEESWCSDFINFYGVSQFLKLLSLLQSKSWGDDLNSSNVGYKNLRPIIIDFSGFREKF